MRLISNIRYTFLISIFNMIRPTLRLIYGKCHFYLPWWIKNDRSLDPNYLHAPLNRTAFCESSPSIKLGPEPWQRGQPRAANVAHSSMDQIREKQKNKNHLPKAQVSVIRLSDISRNLLCGYGGGNTMARKTKESFIIICPAVLGNGDTKNTTIPISTLE